MSAAEEKFNRNKDKIKKMRAAGDSYKKIGRAFGLSDSTIKKYLDGPHPSTLNPKPRPTSSKAILKMEYRKPEMYDYAFGNMRKDNGAA